MKIILITGPPFSGKGTQCEILSEKFNYKHISTGERVRLEKNNGTAIGLLMEDYEKKGDLVPDQIMKDLVRVLLDENKSEEIVILDGYPRTVSQVDDLINILNVDNEIIQHVINIDVSHFELLIRASKRAENSDREDDKKSETHLKRISVFELTTLPAIEYLNTKFDVKNIDGSGGVDETALKIELELA